MKKLKLLSIGFMWFTLAHSLSSFAGEAFCQEEGIPFSISLNEDHSAAQIFYENQKIKLGELVCQKNLSDMETNFYLVCSSRGSADAGYASHFLLFSGKISAHISELSPDGIKLFQSLSCN